MFDQAEYVYCYNLLVTRGNDSVGRVPSVIASYLRLQASIAFRAGDMESAARLGHAATMINWSADNKHAPRWRDALAALILDETDRVAAECDALEAKIPF